MLLCLCRRTTTTELSLNFVAGRGAAGDFVDVKPQGDPVGVHRSPDSFSQPEEVMGRGSRYLAEE